LYKPLEFTAPTSLEVSRILSKALAASHETVRRAKRGELFFAQSLLEELRSFMMRLDAWLHQFKPTVPLDLKVDGRLSPAVRSALERSYVPLRADAIETAAVEIAQVLADQIPALHAAFALERPVAADLQAARLVSDRQVQ
jgi:hypothetical protein